MNTDPSRRDFLKKSAGAGALLGFPTIIPASVLGQNGKVAPSNRAAIGVIGCGNRARSCNAYLHYPKAEIVAACDPYGSRLKQLAGNWGVKNQFRDFRELIARDDVDAVHIVTPDHWHVPISLAAARAGKDVYCEKPLGISIEQNLAAREIVDKHDRVFQYGTQQRSMDACRMGIDLVLNGHIGEVQEIYAWAPEGKSGGDPTPQPVPDDLDFDLWLGPAPKKPYCADRISRQGSWYIYDYAIGFIAGWGAHPLDQLQWWADELSLGIPVEYQATGGIADGPLFNTVERWNMEATYANGLKLTFQDRVTAREKASGLPNGMSEPINAIGDGTMFVGNKGWISVSRGALKASSDELRRKAKDPGPIRLPVSRNHFGHFADCVLSRQQTIAPLESAIRSDIISHMGDICIRTGETVRWDPVKKTVVGSADAVKMMHRPMRAPWVI